MRALKHWYLVLLLVAGCAQLGAPAPQSVGQSIFYAETVEVGLVQSLDNAVLAGTVNKAQATQAQGIITQIDAALSAAG